MSEKNPNYELNPFPTSAKPVFVRVGLLFVGVLCLWLLFHYLDKNNEGEENQPAQAPAANPKYKVPQGFGE